MLSVPHLIIVFLVALLVFGPEKLPELARTLSKAMGEFHRLTGDFQETLQREMRQLEREATEQSPGSDDYHPETPVSDYDPASLALPESASPQGESPSATGESAPAGAGPQEPSGTGGDVREASAFEGLGYDDAAYVASVAKGSTEKSAETPPVHESAPEAGNSSSEDNPPLAGGAEKPVNDHPTAA